RHLKRRRLTVDGSWLSAFRLRPKTSDLSSWRSRRACPELVEGSLLTNLAARQKCRADFLRKQSKNLQNLIGTAQAVPKMGIIATLCFHVFHMVTKICG